MAVINNTTTTSQMSGLAVREVDFIERFQRSWAALREVLGVARPIRKTPGTKLAANVASITLQSGTVTEGDEVPLSQATVTPVAFSDIALQKYRKAVTAEAVAKYGAAVASQKTDDAMLAELTGNVLSAFYTFAQTGTLIATYSTFQMGFSMAVGKVKNAFQALHRDYSNVVVFVNTLDLYEYLGSAQITVQNQDGLQYIKNFLGADTVILTNAIPQGKIVATPAENIVLYYIDPADADFRELGLEYTTAQDEFNLIGVHKEGNYGRVMGETHVLMGMVLFAELLNGIAVISFGTSPTDAANLKSLSVGALTLSPTFAGGTYVYTASTSNASNAVSAAPKYNDANMVIYANGTEIDSGDSVTWNAGANNVTVMVQNDDVSKVYQITVTKS